MAGVLYLQGLPRMDRIAHTWSAFRAAPLSPPSSPEKPSESTHDNITHSEANVFTMHRHGSVPSIITALWLQPSHFSNNAQMYQLLLLYNENRWETGDKPCLLQREGKKVLANQKMALRRILSTVKVPYGCCCMAGLMQKIAELTITLIYLIQASVLLTKSSFWPLETGSMCLRLCSHLASPGTMNSGQVLLHQEPHVPDRP